MRVVLSAVVAVLVVFGATGAQVGAPDGTGTVASGARVLGDGEYGDDSAWGVDEPLDNLVDDLDLEATYPDQYSGGEVFYDQHLFKVGWKGKVPEKLIDLLDERGQRDWVRFVPVRYSEAELLQAANELMDRLEAAGIETHSASSFDDSSAGWVKYYNKPWGARFRAEQIASQVSLQTGVTVRAVATLEPLAVAVVG